MKKGMVIIALLGGYLFSASAAKIVDYQMNEVAGKTTSELINSGTDNSSITGDAQGVATDGSGNLHYAAVTASNTKKQVLSTSYSGTVQLELRLTDWDYTANADGDGIAFSIVNSVDGTGLKALVDHKGTDTRIRISSSSSKQKLISSVLSGSDLVVRAVADLDASTYTADYNLGGAGWINIATDEALGATSIDEFKLITATDSSWGSGAYANVDYVTVETVPEPATLSLIALLGGGLFFFRRSLRVC